MFQHLDTDLFFAINSHHSEFWDYIFWWASDKYIWIPFYALIIFFIIKTYKKQAFYYILAIILAVGASDFIASGIIKPLAKRLRPTHESSIQNSIHILHNYTGGEYGMASSHAANCFALAMILWLFFRKKIKFLPLIFVWSFVVAYSRIYLGVHYPTDVFVGILIGLSCAFLSYKLFNNLIQNKKL